MKDKPKNDQSLEAYKIFPYVAWGVTVLFALFVYSITLELKAVTDDLQVQTQALQTHIKTNPQDIEDFDRTPATTE